MELNTPVYPKDTTPPIAFYSSPLSRTPSRFQLYLIIVLTILLITSVGFIGFLLGNKQMDSPAQVNQPRIAQTYTNQEAVQQAYTFVYKNNDNTLWVNQNGIARQISQANQLVELYEYNYATNVIAYSWGEPTNTSSLSLPHTVTTVNLDKMISQNVYHEETKQGSEIGNPEYFLIIRHLRFSSDGQTLFIATSDSIYSYNTITTKLSSIMTNRTDPNDWKTIPHIGLKQIYGYSLESLSPDDKYLLVFERYYEWVKPIILNLQTNQLLPTKLDEYTGYNGRIVGWYDNNRILTIKHDEGLSNTKNSLYLYDIYNFQSTFIKTYYDIDQILVINNLVYFTMRSSGILISFDPNDLSTERKYKPFNFKINSILSIPNTSTLLIEKQDLSQEVSKTPKLYEFNIYSEALTQLN